VQKQIYPTISLNGCFSVKPFAELYF